MKKTYILLFIICSIVIIRTYRIEEHCIDYVDKDGLDSFLEKYELLDDGSFGCKDEFSCDFNPWYGLPVSKKDKKFDTPVNEDIKYCFNTKDIIYLEYDDFFTHVCDLFFPFSFLLMINMKNNMK